MIAETEFMPKTAYPSETKRKNRKTLLHFEFLCHLFHVSKHNILIGISKIIYLTLLAIKLHQKENIGKGERNDWKNDKRSSNSQITLRAI